MIEVLENLSENSLSPDLAEIVLKSLSSHKR
jgi:hypothetical protein